MTGLGMCQILPRSPPGAVSREMAKPWVGCSLISASTVHSASDSDGPAFMNPSVLGTCGAAADLSTRRAHPVLPTPRVTDLGSPGSLIVTSYLREACHVRPDDQYRARARAGSVTASWPARAPCCWCTGRRHRVLRADRRDRDRRRAGHLSPMWPIAALGHRPSARTWLDPGHLPGGVRPGTGPVAGGPRHPQAPGRGVHLPPCSRTSG